MPKVLALALAVVFAVTAWFVPIGLKIFQLVAAVFLVALVVVIVVRERKRAAERLAWAEEDRK